MITTSQYNVPGHVSRNGFQIFAVRKNGGTYKMEEKEEGNSHENSTTAMRVFPVMSVDPYIISDISRASHRICTPSPSVVLQAFDLSDTGTRCDAIIEYMLLL